MTLVALFVVAVLAAAAWRAMRPVFFALLLAGAPGAAAQVNVDIIRPVVTEQWVGWENLNAPASGGPECVATQPNRLDCFITIAGGEVSRTHWDGARWIGPTLIGGLHVEPGFDSRPECVSWAADHIDCFVRRANDGVMFQRTIHGSFMTGWQRIGGQLTSDPDCVSLRAERLDCFARNSSGGLMRVSFDGNVWSDWTTVPGVQVQIRTKPACVAFRGDINCVVIANNNTLRHVQFPSTGGMLTRDMQGGTIVEPGLGVGFSVKCYVTSDPDFNSAHDDRLHCFAPRFGELGRWDWSGQGNWSISNLGQSFSGGDWDCVARSSQRIDCVELLPAQTNPQAVPLRLRHRIEQAAQSVTINTHVLQNPVGVPAQVRCVSWAADRFDCFAGGDVGATMLLHAAFVPVEPPPQLQPGRLRPPIRQP